MGQRMQHGVCSQRPNSHGNQELHQLIVEEYLTNQRDEGDTEEANQADGHHRGTGQQPDCEQNK